MDRDAKPRGCKKRKGRHGPKKQSQKRRRLGGRERLGGKSEYRKKNKGDKSTESTEKNAVQPPPEEVSGLEESFKSKKTKERKKGSENSTPLEERYACIKVERDGGKVKKNRKAKRNFLQKGTQNACLMRQ